MDTSAARRQQGNNDEDHGGGAREMHRWHHAIDDDEMEALTTGSSSMAVAAARQEEEEEDSFRDPCICCGGLILIAGFVTLLVLLTPSKDPVYSVTVTGVAGLDGLAANYSSSLSPVFNLTVRIDNAGGGRLQSACIGSLSTVSVSYGDAVLAGRGSVPEFCAKGGKVRERDARAWGKDVDLPQFLWDQLAGELAAGEAAVDVKVTTPAESDTVLVCSQVKIGGGPATCRKYSVYHEH